MNLAGAERRHRLRAPLFEALLWSLALPAFASANAGGGVPVCKDESELAQAAAEILQAGSWRSAAAVSQAVRDAGSDVVLVRGFYAADDAAGVDAFLDGFVRDADAPVVCGLAANAAARVLIVAARAGSLARIGPNAKQVRGELVAAFRDPELVVSDAKGALTRFAVSRESLASGVQLPEGFVHPLRLQLLARGPHGVRPVAERVESAPAPVNARVRADALAAGVARDAPVAKSPHAAPRPLAPTQLAEEGPSASTSRDKPGTSGSEQRTADAGGVTPAVQPSPPLVQLMQAVARLRSANGRRGVRPNQLLDRVAQQQASWVCESGRVGHEPEPGEDPQQRLLQAGVTARRVGEAVARGEDEADAFSALERSPAHRMSLLEPGFTDGGYGRAHDAQGRVCVVVLLASWPRYVGR